MNSFHSFANTFAKETVISSKENPNGTTSVKATAHRINLLFLISLVIGWGIIYSLYVYWGETELIMCQQNFMEATNSVYRHNETYPNYKLPLPTYDCNKLISWTSSGATIVSAPKRQEVIDKINKRICEKQINSPLCKDKSLLGRLYDITEERLPMKQFFPILIGMTNAESSLGLDFAKDKIGGTCTWRNNWGWAKYNIKDDNTREYSREYNWFLYWEKYSWRFVDQYGCNLFPFESIEEYWISKVNGIRYWYKGCVDSAKPIECISYAYVGNPKVAERSWINNVSYFLN